MIRSKDLSFFDLTYKRLMQRMKESKVIYTSILSKPLDLNDNETINVDYEKLPYAATMKDLDQRWRKQLELAVLSDITDKEDIQNAIKSEILDESSATKQEKPAEKTELKSFEELEKTARKNSF